MSNEQSNTPATQQPKDTSLKALFAREDVKGKFQEMLGKKATGFMVSVMNAVNTNPQLRNADPNSVMFAAGIAASLDLPIDNNLGFAALIPYNQKQQDGTYKPVCQFQVMVRGYTQLALRSGQFQTISNTAIYEGQIVSENPLTGYVFDFTKKTSDKVVGYAAYFKLINGFEKTLYMTVEECKKHGSKYSKTFKNQYGLWNTDFDAMAIKTVTKLLLAKYAPLSIEMQTAIQTDQAKITDWDGSSEYVDHEEVSLDPEAVSAQKEYQRILDHISNATDLETLQQVEEWLSDDIQKTAYDAKKKELTKKK